MNMEIAQEKLKTWIKSNINATCPRFDHSVFIILEEGNVFHLHNAFLIEIDDTFLGVITEHEGSLVFAFDDLILYKEFAKVSDILRM